MRSLLKFNYTIHKTKEIMRMKLLIERAELNNQCVDHFVNAEYYQVIKYQPHSCRFKFCSTQTACHWVGSETAD